VFRCVAAALSVALVMLIPAAVRADQPAPAPPPFTSLDLRYSPGFQYVNFAQIRGPVIFPNITYQWVGIFGDLSGVSFGGGYQFLRTPSLILAVTANIATNSQGLTWVEPGLALYWVDGRLTVSGSGGVDFFLNSSAQPLFGLDPVEAVYRLDDHWSVGMDTTSFILGQPVATALLPLVRYSNGHGFYELRMDNLGPGYSRELQFRWVAFW
jgi:hypothetical protein